MLLNFFFGIPFGAACVRYAKYVAELTRWALCFHDRDACKRAASNYMIVIGCTCSIVMGGVAGQGWVCS